MEIDNSGNHVIILQWKKHSERNCKITTLNGTLTRTKGEKGKGPRRSFQRISLSRRYNYSWKSRASLFPISNQKESHLILQNCARAQTHKHTQSRGTVALYHTTQWKISEPRKQSPLVKSEYSTDGYQANRPWRVVPNVELSLTWLSLWACVTAFPISVFAWQHF